MIGAVSPVPAGELSSPRTLIRNEPFPGVKKLRNQFEIDSEQFHRNAISPEESPVQKCATSDGNRVRRLTASHVTGHQTASFLRDEGVIIYSNIPKRSRRRDTEDTP